MRKFLFGILGFLAGGIGGSVGGAVLFTTLLGTGGHMDGSALAGMFLGGGAGVVVGITAGVLLGDWLDRAAPGEYDDLGASRMLIGAGVLGGIGLIIGFLVRGGVPTFPIAGVIVGGIGGAIWHSVQIRRNKQHPSANEPATISPPAPVENRQHLSTTAVLSLVFSVLGIFGIVPFGYLLGIFCGFWAKHAIRRRPESKGNGFANAGIAVGVLSLLVFAIVWSGLLQF